MESNKTGGIIAIIIAVAVLVAGAVWFVNRDSDSVEETNTQSSQTQPAEQTEQDIVSLASSVPSLSTLVTAVQAAGLVETLQGDGPFTVLAPTNDAFAALPAGTLDSLLLPENKDQLAAVLTYHVIAGEVKSSELTNGQVVTTVQGGNLTVEITDGMVYFVDAKGGKAKVAQADVEASNGVVHVIDAVLLPQ
jgi:uncharacterized surface protein with fasciclin (FAS1) repeats